MNQIVEKELGVFTQGLPPKPYDCGCGECQEINEFAYGKLPLEYPSEIGRRLCLLSGQSICHFIPGLMKMAFEENEIDLADVFSDCETGAVPALGPAYDLDTIVDPSLRGQQDIYFEGGDHKELVHLAGEDFEELMEEAEFMHCSFHHA